MMSSQRNFFSRIKTVDLLSSDQPMILLKSIPTRILSSPGVTLYFWRAAESGALISSFSLQYFIKLINEDSDTEMILAKRFMSAFLVENFSYNTKKIVNIYSKAKTSDAYICLDLLKLGTKIEGRSLVKLLNKVFEIIQSRADNNLLFGHEIIEWVSSLSSQRFYDEAFDLFGMLIHPRPVRTYKIGNHEVASKFFTSSESFLTTEQIEELFAKKIEYLVDYDFSRVIKVIEANLDLFLEKEYKDSDKCNLVCYDPFQSGDVGLSDELGYLLYHNLKLLVSRGVFDKNERVIEKFKEYLNGDILLFKRLAIWVISQNMKLQKALYLDCFNTDRFILNYYLSNDLLAAYATQSNEFNEEETQKITEIILSIDVNTYPWFQDNLPAQTKEAMLFYRLLNPFKDKLQGYAKDKYVTSEERVNELRAHSGYLEKESRKKDLAAFRKVLTDLTLENFWDKIFEVAQTDSSLIEECSEDILHRVFTKYEILLTDKFIELPNHSYLLTYKILTRVNETPQGPLYSNDFFNQFIQLAEKISQIRRNSKKDSLVINLGNIQRYSLDYLAKAIKQSNQVFSIDQKQKVLRICKKYFTHKTENAFYLDRTVDSFDIVTEIINHTSSKAFLVIVELGLFEKRNPDSDIVQENSRAKANRILSVIEEVLIDYRQDLILNASFGLVLRALYYLDSEFVRRAIPLIFPEDDPKIWLYAFNAFLYDNNIHSKLFPILKPYYEAFCNQDHEPLDNSIIPNFRSLSAHLLNATLMDLDPIERENNLLLNFVRRGQVNHLTFLAHNIHTLYRNGILDRMLAEKVLHKVWATSQVRSAELEYIPGEDSTTIDFNHYFVRSLYLFGTRINIKRYYSLIKSSLYVLVRPFSSGDFFIFLSKNFEGNERQTVLLLKHFAAALNFGYYFSEDFKQGILDLLKLAVKSEDHKVQRDIAWIVNQLGVLGFYELRDFWEEHFS